MTEENEFRTVMSDAYDRITSSEAETPQAATDRDERGRFAAKTAPEAEGQEGTEELPGAPEDESSEPATEADTDQGNDPSAEPAEQPLSPPDRWSAEWKTQFASLPREAQQVLLERETEYNKGFTQTSQEAAALRKQYEPLEQVLGPRRQNWQMQGMNETQAVGQLLAISDYADKDPAGFIQWFAQQRGINLSGQTGQQPEGQPPTEQAQTPGPDYVRQEIQAFKQSLEAEKVQQEINTFKEGKEHFDTVRPHMSALMQSGAATSLQDAYDQAVWANPTVREQILATKQTEAEAKRKSDAAAAAAKAKKSSSANVTSRSPMNSAAPAALSIRDTMERKYDQLHGSV